MTPEEVARIHQAAFAPDRGWRAEEVRDLLRNPHVSLHTVTGGFALVMTVAGEAELISLAVHPEAQRAGRGSELMHLWMNGVDAHTAFLEVAADNTAARALYEAHGFAVTGRRAGYYARPGSPAVDAVLMKSALKARNAAETPAPAPETG
ncbi:GNAT family N-acetyltransferase [Roseobacter ponti]|uniref:GNAT family N-acetyltransferase n=1 Tax=Roseobacter ponti TaxID=1891787 RepID=A0A858STY7_9RHOB|nr:GNAT family N-acetyltransferase [Roseobacter ponti]QJF52419.1 GNAT family N-acetyltransferase [Roseobacter ponti]